MSVRWKPLIVLSALFVVVAAVGLIAITATFLPGGADAKLQEARASAQAGRYDHAEIQYRNALQLDPRDPAIHEEFAGMLGDWIADEPDRAAKLGPVRVAEWQEAAKYGPRLVGPRRALLDHAVEAGNRADAVYWAESLRPLDPDYAESIAVLTEEALDRRPPDAAEARKLVDDLARLEPDQARTTELLARVALAAGDSAKFDALMAEFRPTEPDSSGPIDERLARASLRRLDLDRASTPAEVAARGEALREEVAAIDLDAAEPGQVRRLTSLIRAAQDRLAKADASNPDAHASVDQALEAIVSEGQARAVADAGDTDLRPYLDRASYLLVRGDRAECLKLVGRALDLAIASQPAWQPIAMELREVGIKAALSDGEDPDRVAKATALIGDLLAAEDDRYQALGHLFQGVIDLERSGIASPESAGAESTVTAARASAVEHLKAAAAGLQDVPTAQALYGVALILTDDPNIGRQYLQKAQRISGGKLDVRYQIWAAWSVLQAGYPEDAEPIVDALLEQVARAELPASVEPGLRVLKGEIYQSRRSPADLSKARDQYRRAIALGLEATPTLKLRLAQLDAQLGDAPGALTQIDELRGMAGPAAEQVAILTLRQQGKTAEADARMTAARARFPESGELAGLEAATQVEAGDPQAAEATLAKFLQAHPESQELVLLRARLLAGPLKRPDEARSILNKLAERSETSVPLVQLALLELGVRDLEAASAAIAKVRARWPEASSADLLDAQLAFARGDVRGAGKALDAALEKDPSNKVAAFWKAQVEGIVGSPEQARAVFERLAGEASFKELDAGLSLSTASRWALASMALEARDYPAAVAGFEALAGSDSPAAIQRAARWKLVEARTASGNAPKADAELAGLVADPATTSDERVRAADFLRKAGKTLEADEQLKIVLRADPTHAGALTYRSLVWASAGKVAEAVGMLRKAVDAGGQPAGTYVLLGALETASPAPTPRPRRSRRSRTA